MARKARVNPGSLVSRTPEPVFASEALWRYFHDQRREIDSRYPLPSSDPEEADFMARMRSVARDQLRTEVRRMAGLGMTGNYLVPA